MSAAGAAVSTNLLYYSTTVLFTLPYYCTTVLYSTVLLQFTLPYLSTATLLVSAAGRAHFSTVPANFVCVRRLRGHPSLGCCAPGRAPRVRACCRTGALFNSAGQLHLCAVVAWAVFFVERREQRMPHDEEDNA